MPDELPRRILSREMFGVLTDAGIIRPGDYVRRVIIDIEVGQAVIVHVERYGDERFLSLIRTLDGIEVHCGKPGDEGESHARDSGTAPSAS